MNLIYHNVVGNANSILGGINCSVGAAVQPVTANHLRAARDLGGDAIDLDPARGNFVSELPSNALCRAQIPLQPHLLTRHSRPYLRLLVLPRRRRRHQRLVRQYPCVHRE